MPSGPQTLDLFSGDDAPAPGRARHTDNKLPEGHPDRGAEVQHGNGVLQGVEDVHEDSLQDAVRWKGYVPGSIDYFAAEQKRLYEAGVASATAYWKKLGRTWPKP